MGVIGQCKNLRFFLRFFDKGVAGGQRLTKALDISAPM
jgi:hypothetical protein